MTDQPGYEPPSFDKPSGSSAVPPPSAPGGGGGYTPPPGDPAGGYGAPPPAYGSPATQGYGGGGYGGGMPAGPNGELAGWPLRAQAFVVDYIGPWLLSVFVYVFISHILGDLVGLVALGWGLYNGYLQGQTGQSYGKKIAKIRTVNAETGQLIGGGMGVGRFALHILDILPCCVPVGFLWPLWDSNRQTFADKILKTVVVKA